MAINEVLLNKRPAGITKLDLVNQKLGLLKEKGQWHKIIEHFNNDLIEELPTDHIHYLLDAHHFLGNLDVIETLLAELKKFHFNGNSFKENFINRHYLSPDHSPRDVHVENNLVLLPANIDRLTNNALYLLTQEKKEDALKLAVELQKRYPFNLNTLVTLGTVQLLIGQNENARNTLKQALNLGHQKTSLNYQVVMAFAFFLQGQRQLAEQLLSNIDTQPAFALYPSVQALVMLLEESCLPFAPTSSTNQKTPIALDELRKRINFFSTKTVSVEPNSPLSHCAIEH